MVKLITVAIMGVIIFFVISMVIWNWVGPLTSKPPSTYETMCGNTPFLLCRDGTQILCAVNTSGYYDYSACYSQFKINTEFEIFHLTGTTEGYSEVITSVNAKNSAGYIVNERSTPVWFYVGTPYQSENINCIIKEYYDSLYVNSYDIYLSPSGEGQGKVYSNDKPWYLMSVSYPNSKPSLIRFEITCKGESSGYTAEDMRSISLTYA